MSAFYLNKVRPVIDEVYERASYFWERPFSSIESSDAIKAEYIRLGCEDKYAHNIKIPEDTEWKGVFERLFEFFWERKATNISDELSKVSVVSPKFIGIYASIALFSWRELSKTLDLPSSMLSEKTIASLKVNLINSLSKVLDKVLLQEVFEMLPLSKQLELKLSENSVNILESIPSNFSTIFLESNLADFFIRYPVLARIVSTLILNWIDSNRLMFHRVYKDVAELKRLGQRGGALDIPNDAIRVFDVSSCLADSHNKGKSVYILTLSENLKVVYKPRPVGLEFAWNEFLSLINENAKDFELGTYLVIDKGSYGWCEYIEYSELESVSSASAFYEKLGKLLFIVYMLKGTDIHQDNIVASKLGPILVDLETLFHVETSFEKTLSSPYLSSSLSVFWESVLRTGILPRWESVNGSRGNARDVSGVGVVRMSVPVKGEENEGQLSISRDFELARNMPAFQGEKIDPARYTACLKSGFLKASDILKKNFNSSSISSHILKLFRATEPRIIIRPTKTYTELFDSFTGLENLRDGLLFSMSAFRLSKIYGSRLSKKEYVEILQEEIRSICQGDIPFFLSSFEKRCVFNSTHSFSVKILERSPWESCVLGRGLMSSSNINTQLMHIDGAMTASSALKCKANYNKILKPTRSNLGSRLWIGVDLILDSLLANSSEHKDRLIWMGVNHEPTLDRYQYQPLDLSLYNGLSGVGMFFAAHHALTKSEESLGISNKISTTIQQEVVSFLDQAQSSTFATALGGATGFGSLLYYLTTTYRLVGRRRELDELAKEIGKVKFDLAESGNELDVISGVSGTIVSLIPLYQLTKDRSLLNILIEAANHLIGSMSTDSEGRAFWPSFEDYPLTGMSHGSSGIILALSLAFKITRSRKYLDAVLAGVAFEEQFYCNAQNNWGDGSGSQELVQLPVQWCHGAGGIVLARIKLFENIGLGCTNQRLTKALNIISTHGISRVDHLCCGNLGRAEVLLEASRILKQPNLHHEAKRITSNVLERAIENNGFSLFANLPNDVFNPGFFTGLSGIGYHLLRTISDDLPCVLGWG